MFSTFFKRKATIALLGHTGVGKSTFGKVLSKSFDLPYFSVQDYIQSQNISQSSLNDQFYIQLFDSVTQGPQSKSGIVLNGFPQSLLQAHHMDTIDVAIKLTRQPLQYTQEQADLYIQQYIQNFKQIEEFYDNRYDLINYDLHQSHKFSELREHLLDLFNKNDGRPKFRMPNFVKKPSRYNIADYTIDCSKYDFNDKNFPPQELVDLSFKKLDEKGLIIYQNTGVSKPEHFKRYAEIINNKLEKYEGGSVQRNTLFDNVYDTGVPPHVLIQQHAEMSYHSHYCTHVTFGALNVPKHKGGGTYANIVDMTDEILKTNVGKKLKEKGVIYYKVLTNEEKMVKENTIVTWQFSFGCKTKEEMNNYIAQRPELKISWIEDDHCILEYKTNAYEYYDKINKNVFYLSTSSHGIYFDHYPPFDKLPNNRRPYNVTYGDGEELTNEELFEIEEIYHKYSMPIPYKNGEISVLDNRRWTHGRDTFKLYEGEKRDIAVMIGRLNNRIGQNDNCWI